MSQMMDAHNCVTGSGADGAPISPDAWKRAVYRPPPSHFSVELLSPTKQGSSYSYGMRICPIRGDNRSQSSNGSNSEYEVWRRWEDCLWFQDCLELEYERMSRMKRKRLIAGKGVKKNGVYIQKDHAASFESLPPGPDPNSVTKNIHDYVPKLTKKGTLFRASQATLDQRYRELQACIDGLFQEDVPVLIQELRESRKVTDFFGYWRRDFDLAVKQQKGRNPEKQPRHSISSSVFSTYFTASNPDLLTTADATLVNPIQSSPRSPSKHKPHGHGPVAGPELAPRRPARSPTSPESRFISSAPAWFGGGRPSSHSSSEDDTVARRGSDASTSSSAGPPSPIPICARPVGRNHIGVVPYDMALAFGHNPDQPMTAHSPRDRVTAGLQSLPEDQELVSPLSGKKNGGAGGSEPRSPTLRARRNTESSANRNAQVFMFEDNEAELSPGLPNNRMSWQTTTSVAATISPADYLSDLGTDLSMPKSPTSMSSFPRGSVASFASFMTDSSADAIVPRSGSHRSFSAESRQPRRPISGPEEPWSDTDDDIDLIDTYFNDAFGPSSSDMGSRSGTPLGDLPSSMSIVSWTSSSSGSARARSRSSTFSDTSTIADGHVSVKVMHNTSIILLRVHRAITFDDIRAKVYEKFVTQEGIPLSQSFALAYLPPAPIDYSKPRSRSSSVSSSTSSSVGFPDLAHMRFISSQREWEQAIITSTGRGKLTLRAIGDQGI